MVEIKVKQTFNSPEFKDDKLAEENPVLIAIKKYFVAVLNYSDQVKKAKKSLSFDEIEIVEKVLNSVMVLTQENIQDECRLDFIDKF
jgi:hypothetical protein